MRVDGLDFVAIDFETANSYQASVCSVGLVWVAGGEVTDQRSMLIRPNPAVGGGAFNPWNVRIHGITPDMVVDAPTFAELYDELAETIGGATLVAHNAVFDRSCLAKACDASGLPPFRNPWACTMLESRRMLPGLPNHKLPTVAAALGVTQVHHHDAGDDALVAARIHIGLAARHHTALPFASRRPR